MISYSYALHKTEVEETINQYRNQKQRSSIEN